MRGIYAIVGKTRYYVGSSTRIAHRWKEHIRDLSAGVHHCAHLQRSWARNGPGSFVFVVLEHVAGDLDGAEQRYLDAGFACGVLFNAARLADRPPSWAGKQHKESTKAKMGAWKRPPISEAHRAAISKRQTGREPSPAQLAALALGRGAKNPEAVEKTRRAHLGASRSPEARARMSDAQRKRYEDPDERARMGRLSGAARLGVKRGPYQKEIKPRRRRQETK
jgi:group I intron endonuclease